MTRVVELSRGAQKQIARLPRHIVNKLLAWVADVRLREHTKCLSCQATMMSHYRVYDVCSAQFGLVAATGLFMSFAVVECCSSFA